MGLVVLSFPKPLNTWSYLLRGLRETVEMVTGRVVVESELTYLWDFLLARPYVK